MTGRWSPSPRTAASNSGSTVEDPGQTRDLLRIRPEVAAELEKELFGYLERVEGKGYRPLLSGAKGNG